MEAIKPGVLDFAIDTRLDPPGMARLQRALEQRPIPWSELGDIGHGSALGQHHATSWVDYKTPATFLSVRSFIGTRLLMDQAANRGVISPGESIEPALATGAPVRFIRSKLVEQLLSASSVAPWPDLRAPYPALLVMVPKGSCSSTVANAGIDELAAIQIQCRDGAGGLKLRWDAFGWDGGVWSDGWSTKPMLDIPISKLTWGIVAMLNTAIEVEATQGEARPTGQIRTISLRPDPRWIEPRRIAVATHRHQGVVDGDPRRAHWRQAHGHHFWIGSRKDNTRKLILKWLPATWVDPEAADSN
jgi:hypothetical protein